MADGESAAVIDIPLRCMAIEPQYGTNGPSPRNTSASCISAITFDDSDTFLSSSGYVNVSEAPPIVSTKSTNEFQLVRQRRERSQVEENTRDVSDGSQKGGYEHVDEKSSSKDDIKKPSPTLRHHRQSNENDASRDVDKDFVKGSLFSRIMSGYQEDRDKSSIEGTRRVQERKEMSPIMDHVHDEEVRLGAPDRELHDDDGELQSIAEEIEMTICDDDDDDTEAFTAEMKPHVSGEDLEVADTIEMKSPLHATGNDKSENDLVTGFSSCLHQEEIRTAAESVRVVSNDSDVILPRGREPSDQWREVHDKNTGKVYFYNRRTRESRWSLPQNAVLLRKKRQVGSSLVDCSIGEKMSTDTSDLGTNSSFYTNNCSDDKFPLHEAKEVSYTKSEATGSPLLNKDSCEDEYSIVESDTNYTYYRSHTESRSFYEDDAASQEILERCRKLRESFVLTQKRRFFFPDDSKAHDNETEGETTDEDKTSHYPASSHRCFFCMYCGVQVLSTEAMNQHLRLQCPSFSNAVARRDDEEHRKLQSILQTLWSTSTGHLQQQQNEHMKENIPPIANNLRHQYQNGENNFDRRKFGDVIQAEGIARCDVGNNSSIGRGEVFSLSDDEDTVLNYEEQSRSKRRTNSNINENENESQIASSCPFCSKSFRSGSRLSNHLLRCKSRQKSNKKRAATSLRKEKNSKPSTGSLLQSHLLTNGGRHLPGYPRVPLN